LRATATLASARCWRTTIKAIQLRVMAQGCPSRSTSKKRVALLADSPQLLSAAAGVLARNQPKVTAHLRPDLPLVHTLPVQFLGSLSEL
jgi:hypothetical protein